MCVCEREGVCEQCRQEAVCVSKSVSRENSAVSVPGCVSRV